MSRHRISPAAFALLFGASTLTGCAIVEPVASDDAPGAAGTPSAVTPPPVTRPVSPVPTTAVTVTVPPPAKSAAKSPARRGPRIVYLRVAQKPKCAEGTAVFRADPVPLIIAWKITGATGGALSVDDPTGTPGTYGPVDLQGRQEFPFSCSGDVGTKETHTYALYTVGGTGPVRSKTLTVSASVLDKGPGTGAG